MSKTTVLLFCLVMCAALVVAPSSVAEPTDAEDESGEPCLDVDATSSPPTATWSTDCLP